MTSEPPVMQSWVGYVFHPLPGGGLHPGQGGFTPCPERAHGARGSARSYGEPGTTGGTTKLGGKLVMEDPTGK